MSSTVISKEIRVIQPSYGWRHIHLGELWQYRELLFFLAWRDIKIRYKQTIIGILWALIQPVMTMVVFSIFFGRLAQLPSDGIPYPLFVYAGLLPWNLFAQSLARSSDSVVANAHLVKKVYFPRLITPMAAGLSALVDFMIALSVLFGLMVYYQFPITLHALWLPLLILLTFLCSVGMGIWLSAMNALYRDVRHAVPFFIHLGLFVTPVIYPVSLVEERWQWLLYLNPMAGLIESYRAVLLGYQSVPVLGLMLTALMTGVMLLSGVFFFRRVEKNFADVV